jgi:Caspase domain
MTRHAILLANAAKSSDARLSVDGAQAKKYISDIGTTLSGLGKYSFECHSAVDRGHLEAWSDLNRHVRTVATAQGREPADGSCFLFYYFGHGVLRENDLYLVFKDSSTDTLPTMVGFNAIARLVFQFNIKRAVFVIDCCYAGAAAYSLHTAAGPGQQYSILASAVATQRAEVREGRVPFGAFSHFVFNGLRDFDAADGESQNITIGSLFRYTRDGLLAEGYEQQPQKVDGGLDDMVLSEVNLEIVIPPQYDPRAPRKCAYSKVHWIGESVREKPPSSSQALYDRVVKRRPIEFLTPYKTAVGTKYEPVCQATFEQYVERMRSLGILAADEPPRLSTSGRNLLGGGGRRFNRVLVELIDRELHKYGSSKERIAALVAFKSKTKGIPTAAELYLDAQRLDSLSVASEWFAMLLDLLGQAGFVRFSPRKTFFPY